jgi:hypothetical protein
MPSRRRRKRYRAALEAREATATPPLSWGGWGAASRGDLRLLAHAIRAGWPVPAERRGPLLEAVASGLHADNPRQTIAATRVFLAAVQSNLEAARLSDTD